MKKTIQITIYAAVVWAMALPASAETVIYNSVTTESNTGGGGKASASVDIYTEVNGEVVTDIHEEKESTDGPVSIEKHIEWKGDTNEEITEVAKEDNDAQAEVETVTVVDESGEDSVETDIDGEVEAEVRVSVFARVKTFFKTYVFWWV